MSWIVFILTWIHLFCVRVDSKKKLLDIYDKKIALQIKRHSLVEFKLN